MRRMLIRSWSIRRIDAGNEQDIRANRSPRSNRRCSQASEEQARPRFGNNGIVAEATLARFEIHVRDL